MPHLRWLVVAAILAQVSVPLPPTNLRFLNQTGSCQSGEVGGPMQLILHMMIDNQWERDWGSVLSSQTLVRQLEVDYIRIYQQQSGSTGFAESISDPRD